MRLTMVCGNCFARKPRVTATPEPRAPGVVERGMRLIPLFVATLVAASCGGASDADNTDAADVGGLEVAAGDAEERAVLAAAEGHSTPSS